jgi:hypothetical protein
MFNNTPSKFFLGRIKGLRVNIYSNIEQKKRKACMASFSSSIHILNSKSIVYLNIFKTVELCFLEGEVYLNVSLNIPIPSQIKKSINCGN